MSQLQGKEKVYRLKVGTTGQTQNSKGRRGPKPLANRAEIFSRLKVRKNVIQTSKVREVE